MKNTLSRVKAKAASDAVSGSASATDDVVSHIREEQRLNWTVELCVR